MCIRDRVAGDLVVDGVVDRSFALLRPPGHHANRIVHGARGFCVINNEAIMVDHLRSRLGPDLRVAIVDTDAHHADGTQDIFYNDPGVLHISLHQDGRTLYPGTGFLSERGGPAAYGQTVNIPLPPGTGDEGMLMALEEVVLPILEEWQPDLAVSYTHLDVYKRQEAKGRELGLSWRALAEQIIEAFVHQLAQAVESLYRELEGMPLYTVREVLNPPDLRPQAVVGLGAPAPVFIPKLAEALQLPHEVLPHSAGANAIGAAAAAATLSLTVHADTELAKLTIPELGQQEDIPRPLFFDLDKACLLYTS